jgi:hypothetical protein
LIHINFAPVRAATLRLKAQMCTAESTVAARNRKG